MKACLSVKQLFAISIMLTSLLGTQDIVEIGERAISHQAFLSMIRGRPWDKGVA